MRRLVILLSLALIVGACATVDPLEDNRIEAEVKAGLVAEKSANLTRIGVISTNGVVYLTGTVTEPEYRAKAEDVARSVRGVRRVVNSLAVRPGL